jgi:hypothetical protein
LIFLYFVTMLPTTARRRQTVENEQRTYGIAEWAAALRVRRTEKELAALAAGTREREAARRSSPQEPASAKPARSAFASASVRSARGVSAPGDFAIGRAGT